MTGRIFGLALGGVASAAAAETVCTFTTECYEAEACGESNFVAEVLLEEEIISTEFGDLTIVAVKRGDDLITLFATGNGSEYLMSVGEGAARLSVHLNDGPSSVTYLGQCDGAFRWTF